MADASLRVLLVLRGTTLELRGTALELQLVRPLFSECAGILKTGSNFHSVIEEELF